MNTDYLGRTVRDIVTGFEGICTAAIEWMYGCTQYNVKPKAEGGKQHSASLVLENQLEIVDDGIRGRVDMPPFTEPELFGKVCRDKITGQTGTCVGRTVNLFNCQQYVLETTPAEQNQDSKLLWFDDGRLDVVPGEEVSPAEVRGSSPGGVMIPLVLPPVGM